MKVLSATAVVSRARGAFFSLVALVRNMNAGGSGANWVPSGSLEPLKLPAVVGSESGRANDLLLVLPTAACPRDLRETDRAPPLQQQQQQQQHHVIYFPGDVQSYHDVMAYHSENFRWQRWSLENVAIMLSLRFPNSYIWIVKSSRMHLHKFSCFDNFVESNLFGTPEYSTDFGAFKHLCALLTNACKLAQNLLLSRRDVNRLNKAADNEACNSNSVHTTNGCPPEEDGTCGHSEKPFCILGSADQYSSVSFTLIGFSKGCVVLNQLLHELKVAKNNKELATFIKNIKAMYWLDGGHSGGNDTWVTSQEVLRELAQLEVAVYTHVTPYQVHDTMRSWIGKEHRKFVRILRDFNMEVHDQLHFANEAPSLDNHFKVLEVF
ncbi:mitochondrial protein C2orf69 homolog [Latimeria chalumnae]|uniref:Chromosome 2 open reading frame 69 n=1 Tax=Latimeria chalumnae TaxID=7897 RepID=H3BF60_LATCH|nr:PREDICTED: UPF0565 protein C2orf69 homolog [Latimeria chalumnae]|eukprot:XP_005989576.1 PREDICTED: UPF0565 protein C2orf69 homolog [Latimeria chalumnae]